MVFCYEVEPAAFSSVLSAVLLVLDYAQAVLLVWFEFFGDWYDAALLSALLTMCCCQFLAIGCCGFLSFGADLTSSGCRGGFLEFCFKCTA